jgi:hypothetical protein
MEFVPHVIDGQETESISGERATASAARCCTGSPT